MIKQYARLSQKGSVVTDGYGIRYEQITKGPRIGVMVALAKDKIGWSVLSEKEDLKTHTLVKKTIDTPKGQKTVMQSVPFWTAEKVWEFGTELALKRAEGKEAIPEIIPTVMKKELARFQKRVNAYFKN